MPACGHRLEMQRRRAEMMAVRDADERDAAVARARRIAVSTASAHAGKRESAAGVDERDARRAPSRCAVAQRRPRGRCEDASRIAGRATRHARRARAHPRRPARAPSPPPSTATRPRARARASRASSGSRARSAACGRRHVRFASAAITRSAIIAETRSFDSAVTPAMCGVSRRFGQPASGEPGGQRLLVEHVERGAAETPAAQRRGDGGFVDDAAARGVDEDRIAASSRRCARRRAGCASRRRAARAASARRPARAARRACAARRARRSTRGRSAASCASKPIARMPSARPSRAVRRPMLPKPTMPSVFPPSSRPFDSADARPFACGDVRGGTVRAAQQQHRRSDHVLGDRQRIRAGRRNHQRARATRRSRRRCCRVPRPGARRPSAALPPRAARRSPACDCGRSARPRRRSGPSAPRADRRAPGRRACRDAPASSSTADRVHELADDDAHRGAAQSVARQRRSCAGSAGGVSSSGSRYQSRCGETSPHFRHCVRCQRTPQPGHTPPVANVNHSVPQRGRQLQRALGSGFQRQAGQRISGVFIVDRRSRLPGQPVEIDIAAGKDDADARAGRRPACARGGRPAGRAPKAR